MENMGRTPDQALQLRPSDRAGTFFRSAVVAPIRRIEKAVLRGSTPVFGGGDVDYRSAFDYAVVGTAVAKIDGDLRSVNRAFVRITGRAQEDLLEMSLVDVVAPADMAAAAEGLAALAEGRIAEYELETYQRRSGSGTTWLRLHVAVAPDDAGRPKTLIAQIEDITDRYRVERDLKAQALQDPLTGLCNRVEFHNRVEAELSTSGAYGGSIAVLFIDLDGFKQVNDDHGHAAGDAVLVAVARRLRSAVRPTDTVARHGGDEFTVLLPDADALDAGRVGERILSSLSALFVVDDLQLSVRASIGVSVGDAAEVAANAMLQAADAAMYAAKARGGGDWHLADDVAAELQAPSAF
jgi:diguanylate cyclase (GGDEF)-like protein/PAS domain S-box-containing protein